MDKGGNNWVIGVGGGAGDTKEARVIGGDTCPSWGNGFVEIH